MSGETEKQVSGWTVDTSRAAHSGEIQALRDLMDERDRRYQREREALEETTRVALASAQKAVEKAEAAVEKRLEAMNEFRASLADQSLLLMPRAEAEARLVEMGKQLQMLNSRFDRNEGKGQGLSTGWGILVAAVLLAVAVIGLFLKF